jgi:Flp pilus assembly protein TadG
MNDRLSTHAALCGAEHALRRTGRASAHRRRQHRAAADTKRKDQRGGVAVEFALVLPLLLAILFAVFQFSWYITNYLMLTDAAAVGAHVLASERGYTKPYTDTQTAIFGVMNR